MSNGITGTARDGRLPSIKLHPVKDGVLAFGEVRVTATQRDKLDTERKSSAKDPLAALNAKLPEVRDGRWVKRKGDQVRVLRTLEDGDQPLATCARIVAAEVQRTAAAKRVASKSGTPKRQPVAERGPARDYSQHDAIIRSSGYTGPITSEMRKVAGDVIAFRKVLL